MAYDNYEETAFARRKRNGKLDEDMELQEGEELLDVPAFLRRQAD